MKFSKAEERFLKRQEIGRIATVSAEGMPHVVPVSYIYLDGRVLVAVDYATKKFRNLKSNRKVAFLVDSVTRCILIQGEADLVEGGDRFREIYRLFHRKFSWVRADPWKEGEAPFIEIVPTHKVSWGL